MGMGNEDHNNLYRGFVEPARTREVGDGVFATVQPDGSWGLSNSGFITRGQEVCVVDSLLTQSRALHFREEIRRVCGDKPVRYLVNTHHHSDHVYGNGFFPEAVVVGHTMCRTDMLETGLKPTARDPFVPWGDIVIRPPEITFEDRLRLHIGSEDVDLIYVGPAHTRSDVLVWMPRSKVLFAGDLLFNTATPVITEGSLTGSTAALDVMSRLQPDVIVPGHGDVTDLTAVEDWREYFSFLRDTAGRAAAAGVSPLEAAASTDLGRFGEWQHPDRLVLNLHRAMAEHRGLAPGLELVGEEPFDDMLRLNPTAYGHKLLTGHEQYVDVDSTTVAGHEDPGGPTKESQA